MPVAITGAPTAFVRKYLSALFEYSALDKNTKFPEAMASYWSADISMFIEDSAIRIRGDCDEFYIKNHSLFRGNDTNAAWEFAVVRQAQTAEFSYARYTKEKAVKLTRAAHQFGMMKFHINALDKLYITPDVMQARKEARVKWPEDFNPKEPKVVVAPAPVVVNATGRTISWESIVIPLTSYVYTGTIR